MPEWCAVLKTELTQLRAENERLKGEIEQQSLYTNHVEQLLVERDRVLGVAREAFGLNSAWPLLDVLESCGGGMRHLLADHDCDHHGHENYSQAEVELTDKFIPALREALSQINKVLEVPNLPVDSHNSEGERVPTPP